MGLRDDALNAAAADEPHAQQREELRRRLIPPTEEELVHARLEEGLGYWAEKMGYTPGSLTFGNYGIRSSSGEDSYMWYQADAWFECDGLQFGAKLQGPVNGYREFRVLYNGYVIRNQADLGRVIAKGPDLAQKPAPKRRRWLGR